MRWKKAIGDRQRVAETHAVTPTCLLGLFTSGALRLHYVHTVRTLLRIRSRPAGGRHLLLHSVSYVDLDLHVDLAS